MSASAMRFEPRSAAAPDDRACVFSCTFVTRVMISSRAGGIGVKTTAFFDDGLESEIADARCKLVTGHDF